MKIFLLIILLGFSSHAISGTEDAVKLLNDGKGMEAIKILEANVAASEGDAKLAASYELVDACMLLDDEYCLARIYEASWKKMDEYLKRYDPKDKTQIDTWRQIFDANSAYHFNVMLNGLAEKNLGAALAHEEKGFHGNPNSPHGGLRLVGQAAIASFLGKQPYAEQQLRRARALILNKDPGTLQAQTNLAFLHETSLFYMNDSRDISRWFDANTAVFRQTGKDASNYLNPYIFQRLALVLYNSGILDKARRIMLAEQIHARFLLLQIAEESRLSRKKEEFYAFLSFGDPANKLGLSFDPIAELNKLKSTSFGAMGVKAYLSIESGSQNTAELSAMLTNFNTNYKKLGTSTQLNLAPTKAILESLIAKAENNPTKEAEFLELYIDSLIDFFGKKGYRVGDNNPIQTNPAITVQWYVLNRLGKIKPTSVKRINLGLLMLQSINSSQFGDEESSYSILSKAKNDLEVEQALNFITLKERYGNYVSRAYKDSSDALIKNQTISKPEEKLVVRAESSSFLLDMFSKSNEQLQDIRAQKNDSFLVDYKDISKRLSGSEMAILSAKNDLFSIAVFISQKSVKLKIIDDLDSEFSSSRKLLLSQNIIEKTQAELKDSSIKFSKALFQGVPFSGIKKIYLLNGPSLAGVPYTLLSTPQGGWLIKDITVRAFHATPQFLAVNPPINDYRPTYIYVGFANPILRSDDETSSVRNTANLIRGSSSRNVTSLPELPETELEVRAFAKSLGGNSLIYAGSRATVENLFQLNLNEIEVLGFATHGVMVGEVDGVDSPSIVLTPHNDSGLVTSEILFSLHGAPKVAILSTCNSKTISDSLDQSEITSLATSFSLKGTKSVIASYWAVNSEGTSRLMTTMARYIGQGLTYAEALNKSQLDLMASKEFSHPAFWAAFIGIGDFAVKTGSFLNGNRKSFNGFLIDSVLSKKDGLLLTNHKIAAPTPGVFSLNNDLVVQDNNYFSGLNVQSVKAYQYQNKIFLGVHDDSNYTIFDNTDKAIKPRKICSFPVGSEWYTKKFFSTDQIAYVLFSRFRDGLNEPAVASINLASCEVRTNIFSGALFANGEDVGIQPLIDKNKFLFYSTRTVKDSTIYKAYADELNFPRNCSFKNKLEYYVLDSNFKVLNSGRELNLRIPENSSHSREWIHAIYTNECTFENLPKKINTAWFEQKYLFHDDVGNLVRSGLTEEERLIGRNFTQVMSWSSIPGGDLIYIDGSPGLTSILFASRAKITLSEQSKQAAVNSEFSQFVYQISKKKWLRVGSSSECPVMYPLAFDRDILFACNKFQGQSPEKSSSFIFKAPLN
ncbi:CHAT domain-containing protein [Polynucleobacter meluiroseus]|uniref:CHAT domain-containing protein n=1 Tax=Polynucleobacter meluiroseus TaxID=1938814 RepID=A0A240E2B3_9BURK|nr:CHAT domain-containing protein [Polynucleobacter meluiroseus]SNX29565.1 CHAT domain-containing protein [Polynucleobacter meluiroseus]